MRKNIESFGCYLSCMTLFNLIYLLSLLSKNSLSPKETAQMNVPLFVTIIVSGILVIAGFLFTLFIINLDDSEDIDCKTGKRLKATIINDKTAENYLTNFSVIVLTGIALPSQPDWYVFFIYILIEITIGIVYIKTDLFYMNPVLTLMNYRIYECIVKDDVTDKEIAGKYIFITRNVIISTKDQIVIKNINNRIIWLKKRKK